MIGCQDFCGHYDWTFEYLRRKYGEDAVREYWEQAISRDSQIHARELIEATGFKGMEEYWGHTLADEAAGYSAARAEDVYRIDMFACPSKGYLISNNLEAYHDYCDHCMGWIKPVMDDAGFTIDHEHNHHGQCWWEMRRREDEEGKQLIRAAHPSEIGAVAGHKDVRLRAEWRTKKHDLFLNSERVREPTV
ncbi:MAG: hypothetical protein GW893_04760 [Armatimonadetes bacterium]|nr:hypothetical protein [Armatimonadota bacterium]PIU64123.1 MAG: hypothetical protein COS85_13715 [Armatimonadetes bacterium CG07_land_8_20_14_0_80_59_28]PIX40967.1 MAG: hypothetical protein COZ56_13255 [Armatimonadetes bacterium CG_4_8_14_3_um_filter_58_9]PIY37005.1 MAG: hypothetical protein COZ05_23130 [Armatimonadetes bacterium CG_4_10_14_3_um_filter_59_10]PJB73451.1 MAG: hypothetical protein CO095_05785 [Armatimonadetes bacterium CG_4_9_14_3_um_filter_58_7]